MPTILSARFGQSPEVIRYFHVPIASFYLGAARDYATWSTQLEGIESVLRSTISAIAFSTMAVEALINEAAEEVVPSADQAAFDRCAKPFKRPKGTPEVSFKYRILVETFKSSTVPADVLAGLAELADLRNNLVHYKLAKTAAKAYLTPPAQGASAIVIDFMRPPERIEPPFIQRLTPQAAVGSYNTSVQVIRYWIGLCQGVWDNDAFPEL